MTDVMATLGKSGAWTPLGQTPCGHHSSANVVVLASVDGDGRPQRWVQEQTCMRTEVVRLATDNVLTLRLLEPASVNLPPPLDRSLGDDPPRCPF